MWGLAEIPALVIPNASDIVLPPERASKTATGTIMDATVVALLVPKGSSLMAGPPMEGYH